MAASVQVPMAEYLHTSYRPDREYIDGEIRERHVGKWEHARLQALLAGWFTAREQQWQVMAATEQRMQVAPARIRIPDVVVLYASRPPDVLVDPPLLVIEILSPDDTYTDTQQRAADYRDMGVETVWIIDPKTRSARVGTGNSWSPAMRLEVPGTPIFVDLAELFGRLDASSQTAL